MIIAITSSIGCGKSSILNIVKSKGYQVYSLDEISHEQFDNKVINQKIKETLGIISNGIVTREEVGKIVFQDENKRKLLNEILHSYIIKKMEELIENGRKQNQTIFFEVPLLYEVGLDHYFDLVWFVYTSKEIQIKRLMNRNGYNLEEALARINSQIDIEEKKKIAMDKNHIIIDNNGTLENTLSQINHLLS